jgi:hypothetical protein
VEIETLLSFIMLFSKEEERIGLFQSKMTTILFK